MARLRWLQPLLLLAVWVAISDAAPAVWDLLRVCSAVGKARTLTRAPLRPYYAADTSKMAPNDRTKVIDLRSDTVTRPSAEMYRAMREATVGDDVFGDDPTVNELERLACAEMGFEAAIYVPSGTMANLIAIMVHCPRGGEIIIGDKSHINLYEQGGSASIAGVHGWTLPNNADGTIAIEKLRSAVRADDVHYPVTSLICLENTHNACGGKALPLEYLDQVVSLSREIGIPLHMDGARLANAAIYCRVPMSRILRGFSSSTLCLSKTLGAPVGSLLVGSADFIRKARRCRKVLGGGWRQAGVLAAAGIVALKRMNELAVDFEHARIIAEAVNSVGCPGISVDLENLHTNIVLIELDPSVILPSDFCSRMMTTPDDEVKALGESVSAQMLPMSAKNVRFVLHYDVSADDVNKVAEKMKYVITELKNNKRPDLA